MGADKSLFFKFLGVNRMEKPDFLLSETELSKREAKHMKENDNNNNNNNKNNDNDDKSNSSISTLASFSTLPEYFVTHRLSGEKLTISQAVWLMALSRLRIELRDRRYRLSVYRRCFMGNSLVSWLLDKFEVGTRAEALDIGNKIMTCGFFEHVSREHDLLDKKLFYRFLSLEKMEKPNESILNEIKNGFNEDDYMIDYSKDFSESPLDIKEKELNLKNEQKSYSLPITFGLSTFICQLQVPRIFVTCSELVWMMRQKRGGVDIRDRQWLLQNYKNTFVGREMVNWVIKNTNCMKRNEAVELGRSLLSRNYIAHVTGKHHFEDSLLYYVFVEEEKIHLEKKIMEKGMEKKKDLLESQTELFNLY